MTKYIFDRIMSGEEIRELMQKELGPEIRVSVKKNRIEIVQGVSRACVFLFYDIEGKTVCSNPSGYMPFGVLRIALILGVLVLFFFFNVISNITSYLVFGIEGIVIFLLMRSPSQSMVNRVKEILEKEASKI